MGESKRRQKPVRQGLEQYPDGLYCAFEKDICSGAKKRCFPKGRGLFDIFDDAFCCYLFLLFKPNHYITFVESET